MASLAIYRSMHNVRPGEQHRAARAIELDAPAVAYLGLCDVEVGSAWALDRLTDVRRRMEAEAKLLELYGRTTSAEYAAAKQFIELAREAEDKLMTLVLTE